MTAEATASRWLELAVTCDGEAVEPVSELFASHGFNQGVAIEEAFTQDPDGDNFAVDPTRPVVVRTFLNAADVAAGDDRRDPASALAPRPAPLDQRSARHRTRGGGLGQRLEGALQRPSCRTPRTGEGTLA